MGNTSLSLSPWHAFNPCWECFKAYILLLWDKMLFSSFILKCWVQSGQVCRKHDLSALLTSGGEFQHTSLSLLECQGKVLRTHCSPVNCFSCPPRPGSSTGWCWQRGCCAHLMILKQRSQLWPRRLGGPLFLFGLIHKQVLDFHTKKVNLLKSILS